MFTYRVRLVNDLEGKDENKSSKISRYEGPIFGTEEKIREDEYWKYGLISISGLSSDIKKFFKETCDLILEKGSRNLTLIICTADGTEEKLMFRKVYITVSMRSLNETITVRRRVFITYRERDERNTLFLLN